MPQTDAAAPAVLAERRGAALWIFVNREARRNALDEEVLAGFSEALRALPAQPDVRAVVVTGAGEKAFCAGADLSRGTDAFTAAAAEPTTAYGRLLRLAREAPVPLVARVNGACVAGGMGLLAMCDLAVAADHARFGLPEARVGVFPMQVLVLLRRLVPPRELNALCFTGELVDAGRALEMGLLNEVVPYARLDARVDALVQRIAACSPAALRRGRAAMQAMEGMGFHEALGYAEAQVALVGATEEAREGIAAFNEKRPPSWAA